MFNKDFYPTSAEVIQTMLQGENLTNKTILEPSAGKGDIVDYLNEMGVKKVLSCEINEDLAQILQTKCKVIAADFLTVKSEDISHIDYIIMNPPFSADERHILHAYDIAPAGCKIIALCNAQTFENDYTATRKQLKSIIHNLGTFENLGDCFSNSERKTGVNIGLIKIQKEGQNYSQEFNGFFLEEEPEEAGQIGIMPYNFIRDLVNRYIAAIKIYDEQLNAALTLNNLLSGFYGESLAFTCTDEKKPVLREEFKKDMQKAGWKFIFDKLNMKKNVTRGLREEINKFVEDQTKIPFTMKNIYHMLDVVNQTTGQRMDKALIEVFDRVTAHHHDNRHNIKGWKTNSNFLLGKKFILPNIISPSKEYGYTSENYSYLRDSSDGTIPDMEKALCYVTAINYDEIKTLNASINRATYGEWYESEFFKFKGYKNGNMHFEFMSEKVWELFNQKIAKLKGYPLFEGKEQTEYQKRQTGRQTEKKQTTSAQAKTTGAVLFSFDV